MAAQKLLIELRKKHRYKLEQIREMLAKKGVETSIYTLSRLSTGKTEYASPEMEKALEQIVRRQK